MKLVHVLSKYSDEEIVERVLNLYPEEEQNASGYFSALGELRSLSTKVTEFEIVLTTEISDFNTKEYVLVSGHNPNNPEEKYSLVVNDWQEWLSMSIQDDSLTTYGELDCLAHILWEMTFQGYSNAEVGEFREELQGRIKSIDDGTAEWIPADEVFKKIRDKWGIEYLDE